MMTRDNFKLFGVLLEVLTFRFWFVTQKISIKLQKMLQLNLNVDVIYYVGSITYY